MGDDRVNATAPEQATKLSAADEHMENAEADKLVLPLHSETVSVTRRKVATGRVHISTVTRTHDALIDELLAREHVEIERIPIGRVVETAPVVREEGDVTIIPIIEETIFVEKRIFLKEEVHVRRVRSTEQYRETVVLREQEAVIKRSDTAASSGE